MNTLYNPTKNTSYIILLILLFSACNRDSKQEPVTLEDFTQELAEKKKELVKLENEISELTDQIAELDPSLQEKSKLVDTSQMARQNFTRFLNLQGSVEAEDPVNAVSEIAGRILTLNLKEGDFIQKGAIVAIIDVESYQKQMDEINTSLSLARDIFERQERLWKQNIGSEIQYLESKNNVERLEKSLETIKFQKSKSTIYSPIAGVVDAVMTKQGEVVSPGMPIIQILNTRNLKITTDVPEKYLRIMKSGMVVDLDFPSIGEKTSGRISLLGRKIDPINRTLELEIRPLKTPRLLKPNLLVEISIKELSISDVIMLPLEYILQEVDGTEFIYVVIKDEESSYRTTKRYVTLGEATEGLVVITSGLTEGEAVIFKGSRNVSDGELIEFTK